MASKIELFRQMAVVLDTLIDNAKKMKEAQSLRRSHDEIEALQLRQHEILHELAQLNKLIEQSPSGGSNDEVDGAKNFIRSKLGHFQSLNQEFFDQINTQTRVIDAKDAGSQNG